MTFLACSTRARRSTSLACCSPASDPELCSSLFGLESHLRPLPRPLESLCSLIQPSFFHRSPPPPPPAPAHVTAKLLAVTPEHHQPPPTISSGTRPPVIIPGAPQGAPSIYFQVTQAKGQWFLWDKTVSTWYLLGRKRGRHQ